ncbi:copia protein [Tanacetum coccineum]
MTTLAEHMIVAGAENRPPMLDKSMYSSWQSRMLLYIKGKKNDQMMLESIANRPLVYPTIEENGQIRPKKQPKISGKESSFLCKALDCHIRNENVDCTMSVTSLFLLRQVQVNTKFLNALQPEWSKFVTDVKLARNMYTTNFDQLYAYLSQHEGHAYEVRLMRERYSDPLALATIHDGRVTVQQVQGRQSPSFAGTGNKGNATSSRGNTVVGQARIVKCYNCQGEGHMARQCTKPKRHMNATWFKENMLLAQAQESDAYDSDYDDISLAKAVLMANLSSYDSDVLSECFEKTSIVDDLEDEITSDSNIIPYSQYIIESQQVVVQDTNSSAQQDSMIISLIEKMSEQMTNHVTN